MKLSAIRAKVAESEQSATITIYQKNGQPYRSAKGEDATISVRGEESSLYRAARERIARRAQRRGQRTVSLEEIQRNRIDLAASAVTNWSGWEDDNDQALACTPENVKALLEVEDILRQVEEGIASHADFFAAPSAS